GIRHRNVTGVQTCALPILRGIVHDRSQSGQTLFVEPEAMVEANNDLVALERDEQQETTRILAELTDAVRARRDELAALVETLGRSEERRVGKEGRCGGSW